MREIETEIKNKGHRLLEKERETAGEISVPELEKSRERERVC